MLKIQINSLCARPGAIGFIVLLHILMYQLQLLQDGEWVDTSYMPTVWEVAKRRLSYYTGAFPSNTYSILRIK